MPRRWKDTVAKGTAFQAEFRLRRAADGEFRWFLARAVPVRDGEDRILQWFGTSTDIHAHKQSE